MGFKCCVPLCRANYDGNEHHVPMFSFPKDETLRKKWLSAIHRKDFVPTQHTKVCALHFEERVIRWKTSHCDEKTGKELQYTLKRPRLEEGAIPTKLPGCPAYMSTCPSSKRVSADERRQKKENENLQKALAKSLETKSRYDAERALMSFDVLRQCLERENLGKEWTVVYSENCVLIGLVCVVPVPVFSVSAVIQRDFKVSVFSRDTELKYLDNDAFPRGIQHFNDLLGILDKLKHFEENKKVHTRSIFSTVNAILSTVVKYLDDDTCRQVTFIIEQINLLLTEEQCYRYRAELSAFCSILFSISPHAYKFLRKSGIGELKRIQEI